MFLFFKSLKIIRTKIICYEEDSKKTKRKKNSLTLSDSFRTKLNIPTLNNKQRLLRGYGINISIFDTLLW